MKRLLLILVVLGVSIPASADVFIYNSKQANVSIDYDGIIWKQSKETETVYVIVEPTSSTTAGIWAIGIWKEKDKSGQTTKYAAAEEVGEVDFIQAQVGKKLIWIISAQDSNSQTLLTGQAKPTKIDDVTFTIASSLTGYGIWDESEFVNERDLGTGKITLKLNKNFTAEAHMRGLIHGGEAMVALMDYLKSEDGGGYTEATP
jgi:hypothetical protein